MRRLGECKLQLRSRLSRGKVSFKAKLAQAKAEEARLKLIDKKALEASMDQRAKEEKELAKKRGPKL